RTAEVERHLWQAAEELLPNRHVGDFNQALMELGALVCTPAAPRCGKCPLASACVARRDGLQDVISPPQQRPATKQVDEVAVTIYRGPKVLLVRRPDDAARWANMWEVPHGPRGADIPVCELAADWTGLQVRNPRELLTIRHSVTHHR